MDWVYFDTLKQHFPDYLSARPWWCLGISGQSCLRLFYSGRLLLMGFASLSYLALKWELRSRHKFLQRLGMERYEFQWSRGVLLEVLLIFIGGILIGQAISVCLVLGVGGSTKKRFI
jgi:hypothetical protein